MGPKTIGRSKKNKKARHSITSVIMKDISNINKEFEIFLHKGYVWKRPKHEPTDSYFYLARHFSICMIRFDELNLHVDPVRTEMTEMQYILI